MAGHTFAVIAIATICCLVSPVLVLNASADADIACSAPDVSSGQNASLSFDFGSLIKEASTVTTSVTRNNSQRNQVFFCARKKSDTSPSECRTSAGFTYRSFEDGLILGIPNATPQYSGVYTLQLYVDGHHFWKSCPIKIGGIKCATPAVPEGETADLSFDFGFLVDSASKYHLHVYKNDSQNSQVCFCAWEKSASPSCLTYHGFTSGGIVDGLLKLYVINATQQHSGTYKIKLHVAGHDFWDSCSLSIGGKNPISGIALRSVNGTANETVSTMEDHIVIAGSVVGVVTVVILLIIGIIIFQRRRNRTKKGPTGEADNMMEMSKLNTTT